MFEIDRIPNHVSASLQACGIADEEILLSAFCDRDANQKSAEVYLLASKDTLFVVSGISVFAKNETVERGKKSDRLTWKMEHTERFPLDKLCDPRLEELRSSGRLIARLNGEAVLFSCFTNAQKESLSIFCRGLDQLIRGEQLSLDTKGKTLECCPTCGAPYPDQSRHVCPNCMEKGKILWRMMGFFANYRGRLIMVLLSLALLTATGLIAPYITGSFFYDEVVFGSGEFYGQILLALGLLLATKALGTLSQMINNWVTSVVATKMVFDLKKTIFTAIERLSLSFFSGRQTGGLMTQVNDDSTVIYEFFCDSIPRLIINIVQVVVLTVLLFLIQPMLALISLLTVPLYFLLMRWSYWIQKKLHAKRFAGSRRLSAHLSDVLSGMRVVKAFAREEDETARFDVRSEELARSDRKLAIFHNYVLHAAGILLYLANIFSWALGGWMVITGKGNMTYGMLVTFIAYVNMIYSPLHFFSDMINRTADCTNAMQRLFEIMDAEPDVRESENAVTSDKVEGAVEFRNVSFSYVKGRRVIDNVSFSIPAGGTLGIVGHTGAGKSTLANLMMRLYDAEEGEVLMDGVNVKELSFASLYENIAIVSQETYLFMGTILENIRYAKPDATYEEVIEASKRAGAHGFIMRLPDAYHTKVGFGNQDLSGGEKQRISIARAILKNPRILILDEATAAMDTQTERMIQDAITELSEGKTTIMIAHRLSTLRDADQLIVIERGKVAESGTHAELLAMENGVYKKLYNLQLEALRSAGIAE